MIDFLMISTRPTKRGIIEIYPKFIIRNPSEHLMIRGGDFYAIWLEEEGLWSTNEQDAIDIIDRELDDYAKENAQRFDGGFRVLHMWDAESGMIDAWHKYCQRQMRDSFHMLDEKLIFSNTRTTRKDYASKRLPYPLEKGECPAWNRLVNVLYSPEEKRKIEWAIGAIVSGDSSKLQKFMVFYGAAGTGKSTIINVIQQLFEGYTSVFDAKALGSSSNAFALEAFKSNPLVAIQHDGDLSRIEDNTRLNSLVSHEMMTVNEKFKSTYSNRFKCFLFMGTNEPVRITNAKSGLIRRLIDVTPTGKKVEPGEYRQLMNQINFELGSIASHCMEEYLDHPDAYDDYIPISMLDASNDFYNFIVDSWQVFNRENETTLKAAWEMYKAYCEDAKVSFPYPKRAFKEELKNYFREYEERKVLSDGTRVRNYYAGFQTEKFEVGFPREQSPTTPPLLTLKAQHSVLDDILADCPAQYSNEIGTPSRKWEHVKTTLRDLDTSREHYVKSPENLIVIDFDIPDKAGQKDFAKNLEEASKWPQTYAEVSKSGKGIHLHYWYEGDVSRLSRIYANYIEVKVFNGNSSLRRKLILCNDLPVAKLSHGLPLKEVKKTVNFDSVQSEKGLRELIKRNLAKEIHPATKPSIDFIVKILDDAFKSGLSYDVSDMKNAVIRFALMSSHQSDYCLKQVALMKFKSEDHIPSAATDEGPMIFYDVEVFPNLFLVNWKTAEDYSPKDFKSWHEYAHELETNHKPVARMINPKPAEIEELMRHKLVGFNCRRYDNHILYARLMGYSNEMLYTLSQKIISGGKRSDAFLGEAYNVSYTDVYDFASAANKKSLKKFEIELGIHHQELGLPWDQAVPEDLWLKVAEYCDNDVIATEAVFNYLSADWTARQILADIAGLTVNDTTNQLTTKIIFEGNRKPQNEFNYRYLGNPVNELDDDTAGFLQKAAPNMMAVNHERQGEVSNLPFFPGYVFQNGISTYRDEVVGEGGYVYAEPGMYSNVALLDIASMHPHSVIAECLFGAKFTTRFKELVDGRVSIKHEDWQSVNEMLDGKLAPYVQKVANGEMTSKQLADALKTAINSVYGLTSAAFENAFRDPRNRDNIVAKRGALFMIDLKHAVQERGFVVAHIKTDSIKIPDATPEIIQFVMDFGKSHGYTFEHEATYDKMCLVNDAVYIARYKGGKKDGKWTATGKQFAVPYVFKTLFSREPIEFADVCETVSVSSALYLDMNEGMEDPILLEDELNRRTYNQTHSETPKRLNSAFENWTDEELKLEISKHHDYHFIGRVGRFSPIKAGHGGGILLRGTSDGKYAAASGSKGYRWMESEMVKALGMEDCVDYGFYNKLVNDAIETIEKYGDFECFRSDNSYTLPLDN